MSFEGEGIFLQNRPFGLDDVFKGFILLKTFEFVFTSHGLFQKTKLANGKLILVLFYFFRCRLEGKGKFWTNPLFAFYKKFFLMGLNNVFNNGQS